MKKVIVFAACAWSWHDFVLKIDKLNLLVAVRKNFRWVVLEDVEPASMEMREIAKAMGITHRGADTFHRFRSLGRISEEWFHACKNVPRTSFGSINGLNLGSILGRTFLYDDVEAPPRKGRHKSYAKKVILLTVFSRPPYPLR